MLELMARAGMRVGEVLKLRRKDIEDRKLLISDPKSGKEADDLTPFTLFIREDYRPTSWLLNH
jgi:integrase